MSTVEKRGLPGNGDGRGGVGRLGLTGAALAGIGLGVLWWQLSLRGRDQSKPAASQPPVIEQASKPSSTTEEGGDLDRLAAKAEPAASPVRGAAPAAPAPLPKPEFTPAPAPTLPEPSLQSRQLVAGLAQMQSPDGRWTSEQVVQWKENLQLLTQQGSAGVSAIREFLQKNQDLNFGPGGWDVLGYPSVRAAMVDALRQIGGPEAIGVSLETLQTTADPREVALLAKGIEAQAPEAYRAEILAAARDSLALAGKGQLEGRDMGPLFEVFEKYGGLDAVADLEQAANQWKYYATAALAQLPDGAGVPSLVRMVSESSSPNIPALEALASLSVRNAEAREALLTQVAANRISPSVWPYLSQALTGDETQVADSVFDRVLSRSTGQGLKTTHIKYGNQNFYHMPTIDTLTPDQLNQQVTLVDEFLKAAGSNPAAIQALQQTRSVLTRRLGQAQPAADPASPGR